MRNLVISLSGVALLIALGYGLSLVADGDLNRIARSPSAPVTVEAAVRAPPGEPAPSAGFQSRSSLPELPGADASRTPADAPPIAREASPKAAALTSARALLPAQPVAPTPIAPRARAVPGETEPSERARETMRQAMDLQRLGLAEVDQVMDAARAHPDAHIRQAAVEKLAQLEAEREATQNVERQTGEPGQFVSAVVDQVASETDPAALDAGLDYLVEYGESDPRARQALEGLMRQPETSSEALARIYELLVERYGLTPDAARKEVEASTAWHRMDSDEIQALETALKEAE